MASGPPALAPSPFLLRILSPGDRRCQAEWRIGNSNGLLAPPPRPHPPAPPAGQPGKGAPGMRPPTPPGVPSFCEFSLRTEGIDLNTVHMCSIIVDTSSHTHHLDVVRRVQSWRLLLPPT